MDNKICGHCNKKCTATGKSSQTIQCCFCLNWAHAACEGMTEDIYYMLTKLSNDLPTMAYYCVLNQCKRVSEGILKYVAPIEKRVAENENKIAGIKLTLKDQSDILDDVHKKVDSAEQKFEQMGTDQLLRIEKLEETMKKIQDSNNSSPVVQTTDSQIPVKNQNEIITLATREFYNQQNREKNVILFNVPETDAVNERKTHDLSELKKITRLCEIELKDDQLEKISRIGEKKNDRSARPILVTFLLVDTKINLLKNLHKLKDKNVDIKITNDLTVEQRKERKKLIDEAKRRNENEATDEYKFFVRGPPWALKIVKARVQNKNQ